MSRQTFLVTGGAGFIGSELVRQIAASGRRVVAVDNLANGRRENLAGLPKTVTLAVADIRDLKKMATLLRGVDAVFHLACLGVRHSIHSPVENHDVNATGTLGLLGAAKAAGVKRFVYVSSSEVYGTALRAPMDEAHPTHPMTVYGASKLAGECYARAYHRTYGYATTIVRPFNSYGPRSHHEGDSGEVIPKFILRGMAGRPLLIFGDGSQTRDFTFVEDTARGILLAGLSKKSIGETINLGNGKEATINELARRVARLLGGRVKIKHEPSRPGDVLRLCADARKAKKLLNFSPKVPLTEGLKRLHAWYLARGESPAALLKKEVERNWERR